MRLKKELKGPSDKLGYRAMNQKPQMKHDIQEPRDLVYAVMRELHDEALNRRKHEKK